MGAKNADPAKVVIPPDGLVSLRQFAALVGIDYKSAQKAIDSGRINYVRGSKKIDYASQSKAFNDLHIDESKMSAEGKQEYDSLSLMARARLRKESAAANLKEFELAILGSKYLAADDVKEAVFNYSRNIRDTVLSIPERVSAEVASRIREALRVALLKELDEDLTDKVLKRFSDAECERQVRAAWSKESRDVLSAIGKTPKHDSGK